MIKALAIISGPRQRTTEYLNGMREGYYDLVFLMEAATKRPFAFMTLQNEQSVKIASEKLSAMFTVAAKDTLNDPKAFETQNAYIQKSHGKRADYLVCKIDHLDALGFDETKIQVFMPERPGDVFVYSRSAEGSCFRQDAIATQELQKAYADIARSPAKRMIAPGAKPF